MCVGDYSNVGLCRVPHRLFTLSRHIMESQSIRIDRYSVMRSRGKSHLARVVTPVFPSGVGKDEGCRVGVSSLVSDDDCEPRFDGAACLVWRLG